MSFGGRLEFKRRSAIGSTRRIGGYGAVFGNIDSYGDVIERGAFSDAVAKAKAGEFPKMLLQHGSVLGSALDNVPIGLWTVLREDSRGLYLEGELADTTYANDVWQLLTMPTRPAIDGLSIGFFTEKSRTTGVPRGASRVLEKIRLMEVSIVTFPANTEARIDAIDGPTGGAGSGDKAAVGRAHAAATRLYENIRGATMTAQHKSGDLGDLLASVQRLRDRIVDATSDARAQIQSPSHKSGMERKVVVRGREPDFSRLTR